MIKKLSVKNFKSVKDLEIDCRRINLFIGEPNTGKSNILEALGLLSWCGYRNTELKEYIRFQGTQNLFYDGLFDYPVGIKMEIKGNIKVGMEIKFADDSFRFERGGGNVDVLDYSGKYQESGPSPLASEFSFIKFYRFVRLTEFPDKNASSLRPPHGANMFSVVMGRKGLREIVVRFFKDYGFRPVLKPMERVFEFQKQVDDVIFDYPYILLSDTLQRMIFYEIAMESNKDSTLIFEEPEVHAFPYYTKILGEKIGFDETNQYFIATHNPYLLLSILEKTPKESVNVFITYFRDYQTKVKCLTNEEVSELMDYDPFANLDSFIEEEKE
ncbi:MAG: AAA family ATPase [bacterium]|nr:AAA family ATPase [bacterium]